MCRASIGCGRPMISVTLWFLIVVESLEWPTPCGQRNAVGQDATLWDVAPTRLAGVPQMYANGVCT